MLGGFANRVAWIDLSSGNIEYKGIDEEDARKYIGARGLGVKYVFDNGPEVEPYSPDNLLCVMNGPLTGTDVNMSGRLAVVTKSPLTGTVADAHMGGWTAAKLKWAGFDGLVFKGKADTPVYAYCEGGNVTLHDASDLWGKGIHETLAILKERHGEDVDAMAIGQAGENLVRFAAWVNVDDRAAGRNGTGAVGGSKNLKAIVMKGDRKDRPRPADKDADREARRRALDAIMAEENITSPKKGGLSLYGTNVLMNITESIGALPSKNSQYTAFGADNAEKISGEYVREHILVAEPTCHACPVACKKEVEITEGPFQVRMESVEYEPAWSLGSNCGNDDIASVAFIIDQCNDFGMDPIELGNVLAMYMEASEKGYTNGDGTWVGAIPMAWLKSPQRSPCATAWATSWPTARPAAPRPSAIPKSAMTVKGQAIPGVRPARSEGHGHCLRHQQPRRLPSARLHPGRRTGRHALWLAQGRPAGVEGQGRTDQGLPGRARRLRLAGPVQVLRLCRGHGRVHRAVQRGDRPRATRWTSCSTVASASTTWSATTTTWPASARAPTTCPSASPTSRAPCPAPKAMSANWTTCWTSTTTTAAG